MAEKKFEVSVFAVDYLCDSCQTPLVYAHFSYPTNPPQFKHDCPNPQCRKVHLLQDRFPTLRFDRLPTK